MSFSSALMKCISHSHLQLISKTTECPYDGIEVPLNDKKILLWCAISAKLIFGPYFFFR